MLWSCSIHVDDFRKNASMALPLLAAAKALGCRAVRTDIKWGDARRPSGKTPCRLFCAILRGDAAGAPTPQK